MTVRRLFMSPGQRLHPERAKYLTASDTPAVAGSSPFKSALDVHMEKLGLRQTAETPAMRFGRLVEPVIQAMVEEAHPEWRFLKPNFFLADDETRLGATPDLLAEDPEEPGVINIQMKATSRWQYERGGERAPAGSELQTAHENMLIGARFGIVAVAIFDGTTVELVEFDVPRHPEAEARIVEIARAFWRRIEKGELPAADYAQDGEVLKKLYPPSKDVPVPLDLSQDNRIYELCEQYDQALAAIRDGEARKDVLKNEITEKLKGATLAVADGWKITRVMRHRDAYTVPASDYPDMRVRRTKEAA